MWRMLLEWCADVFGATNKSVNRRIAIAIAGATLLFYVVSLPVARYGLPGVVPAGALLAAVLLGARKVFVAREQLWRAASLPLDDPRQAVEAAFDPAFTAPTAAQLIRVACAIDAARRSRLVEAADLVGRINRRHLRPEEIRLLEAVRAIVSLGLGDDHRAAELAIAAVPTGSDELDGTLGRALLRDAWRSGARIAAIDAAWATAGVGHDESGSLPRLRRLIRVRVDGRGLDALSPDDARRLAVEAEAVGDGDLSAELAARARASRAYR